jgi:hypothetical protein
MFYSDHSFDNGDGGKTEKGKCVVEMYRRDGTEYICNASASSVLHPPDQFRHWCSALEQGFDCMHLENEDFEG